MIRSRVLFFCVTILCAGRAGAEEVRYDLRFENRDHHEAEVQVVYRSLPSGPLVLRMSRTSPGRYALHEFGKNVYQVQAFDPQGRALSIERVSPHQWQVPKHDGSVTIRYTVFGDRCDGTYLAIDNTMAHLNMPATLMWAVGQEKEPARVTFHRPDDDWEIATQLIPTDDPQSFRAPNLQYLMDSPTHLGPIQWARWPAKSHDHTFEIRLAVHHQGSQREVDQFALHTRKVIAEQVAVYGELPRFDYGTYTFLAVYLPQVVGDGMEHRNSTVLTSTRSLAAGWKRNLRTVSHEFFHIWNVERIRPRSLEPFSFQRPNPCGELWFAEGFTSYYDDLILKRAGLMTFQQYAKGLSEPINRVVNTPSRRFFGPIGVSRMAQIGDNPVSNDDTRNFDNTFLSYYTYGNAIAIALDLTLRSSDPPTTLDDFMQAMWQRFGRTETPYTNDDVLKTLIEVSGNRELADDFFNRYISGNQLPDYAALLAKAGLELKKKRPDTPWIGDLGILRKIDAGLQLGSVAHMGSPLYDAGLDRRDVIVSMNGQPIKQLADLQGILQSCQPGETISVTYIKRGQQRTRPLQIGSDPEVEVVTFESVQKPVDDQIQAFRQQWTGSRVAEPTVSR